VTETRQKQLEFSTSVIERIRVYAIQYGSKEYSWSAWMPEMTNTDTLVRLETKDGQTGIGAVSSCSERDIDLSIAYSMRPLLRGLLGKDGLRVEEN
jgi:L-alanine-DL-glutamate epimerase-like enolase superfamily enzyme